jgi:catechol 2,3-dioxygenase-like lactoylglutathione lyase family enzyme
MITRMSHTCFYVLDQDRAKEFYTGKLGFEPRGDVSMGGEFDGAGAGFRWLTVGPPDQPDVEIGLVAVGPPVPPADQDAVRDLVTKGSLNWLIFATDDCRATFERLRASGAEVLQEPKTQSYGVIDCAFRDPSGNSLRFSERLPG